MNYSRKMLVREILVSKPFTSLKELEERFPDVSSMTLRRDIEFFERQGDVIKVRGGARSMKFITTSMEESITTRSGEYTYSKQKIAQAAAQFIETGRSIFFDSGSTVMQLVSLLPKTRLSINTTDPNLALELVKKENVMVSLVGGLLSRDNLSLSGVQAVDYVGKINIDVAFISPSGFSLKYGFTSGNYNESELKSAIVKKAGSVIMLVHSSKIDKSLPYTFCNLSGVQKIVTDQPMNAEIMDACRESGCALIGGETAEMHGFYAKDEYDIAGFCVGVAERGKMITGEKVKAGDILLGLPSSGVHSNGFSLVRKICFDVMKFTVDTPIPEFGCTLGEKLLTPTRLYPKTCLPLIEKFDIHGMVHITGGGFYLNYYT